MSIINVGLVLVPSSMLILLFIFRNGRSPHEVTEKSQSECLKAEAPGAKQFVFNETKKQQRQDEFLAYQRNNYKQPVAIHDLYLGVDTDEYSLVSFKRSNNGQDNITDSAIFWSSTKRVVVEFTTQWESSENGFTMLSSTPVCEEIMPETLVGHLRSMSPAYTLFIIMMTAIKFEEKRLENKTEADTPNCKNLSDVNETENDNMDDTPSFAEVYTM